MTPYPKDVTGSPILRLANSPVTVSVGSESAVTNALDAEVHYGLSNCTSAVCDITFTMVMAPVADFALANRQFTNVLVEAAHAFTGRIDLASGLFVVPAGEMAMYVYFQVDGTPGSIHVRNTDEQVVGFASTSANAFLLTGSASDVVEGEDVAITLSLSGSYEDKGPPVARANPPLVVECSSPQGATVQLDATASTEPDADDVLRYFWYEQGDEMATGPTPTVTLPLGAHTIDLLVYDDTGRGETSTEVTVQDMTGPVITAAVDEPCLWPPNHKLVCLTLGDEIAASSLDACGIAPLSVSVTGVVSDDPTTTVDDMTFTNDTVCLRAERPGNGPGRRYTVTLTSVDSLGNAGTSDLVLTVPHSKSTCPPAGQQ